MTFADGPIPFHHANCLGCGPENSASMGLRLHAEGGRVVGDIVFDQRHEGAPGFAHGGAVATILDDTLGTVPALLRVPAVTANLSIDYRSPAILGKHLRVEAWAVDREGRKVRLAARMTNGETVIAEATALFVEVPLEHFGQGGKELADFLKPRDAAA
jgi:acyl-coenzyme A thioesterase PaaI-like protein